MGDHNSDYKPYLQIVRNSSYIVYSLNCRRFAFLLGGLLALGGSSACRRGRGPSLNGDLRFAQEFQAKETAAGTDDGATFNKGQAGAVTTWASASEQSSSSDSAKKTPLETAIEEFNSLLFGQGFNRLTVAQEQKLCATGEVELLFNKNNGAKGQQPPRELRHVLLLLLRNARLAYSEAQIKSAFYVLNFLATQPTSPLAKLSSTLPVAQSLLAASREVLGAANPLATPSLQARLEKVVQEHLEAIIKGLSSEVAGQLLTSFLAQCKGDPGEIVLYQWLQPAVSTPLKALLYNEVAEAIPEEEAEEGLLQLGNGAAQSYLARTMGLTCVRAPQPKEDFKQWQQAAVQPWQKLAESEQQAQAAVLEWLNALHTAREADVSKAVKEAKEKYKKEQEEKAKEDAQRVAEAEAERERFKKLEKKFKQARRRQEEYIWQDEHKGSETEEESAEEESFFGDAPPLIDPLALD